MYMDNSLCHSPETITTLLISYTPIQNKILFFFLKKYWFSKWKNYPGAMCLCSTPIQLPMRTPPLHINLEDNGVFKDAVIHLMECSWEGKILQLSLKWKHWKRTSPLSSRQWHLFRFSWASSRKDDSTKMPILTFLGPPCSL